MLIPISEIDGQSELTCGGKPTRTGNGLDGECVNGRRLVARSVDELVVDDLNIRVVTRKLDDLIGDGLGLSKGRNVLAGTGEVENDILSVGTRQLSSGLLANDDEVHVGIGGILSADEARKTRVNTTAETLVGAAYHHELLLSLALETRGLGRLEHLVAGLAVCARVGHGACRTVELGRGDNLHGFCDLLDVANRLETSLDLTQGCEGGCAGGCRPVWRASNRLVHLVPS